MKHRHKMTSVQYQSLLCNQVVAQIEIKSSWFFYQMAIVNFTHLSVLVKKDFLTLKRSWGFVLAFIILPIGLMGAFIGIQGLVDNGTYEGNLIYDHFTFTTTKPVLNLNGMSFYEYPAVEVKSLDPFDFSINGTFWASIYSKCIQQNSAKYTYTKMAVVSKDQDVANQMKDFFESYFLENIGIPDAIQKAQGIDFHIEAFTDQDKLFNIVETEKDQPYCMAVGFSEFDSTNDVYEVQLSVPFGVLPQTTLPAYNPLVKSPDFLNWNYWKNSPALPIMPYITEFIARYKSGSSMTETKPLFVQQVGYAPLKSAQFQRIDPLAIQALSQNFPFFLMIIYLIPFFYLISKVASEKESKAKEGMKMMGLHDATYYLAWFICYMVISIVTSILVTAMAMARVFQFVNGLLFFIFLMLFSMNLFAWAFIIVAFLPTKRSSGIAAILINFITFYLSYILQDPSTPSSLQYGLSTLPCVCLAQVIKQIFFYNYNTDGGLTFSTGKVVYQGFSFNGGLYMLMGTFVGYTMLGLYLDQVVPSQFGVAKPWNFCCKAKKQRVVDDEEAALLAQSEQGRDPRNFESVPEVLKKQEREQGCLKVRNLVKRFGEKTAVNGTSMTMYNGQIFALLGHNGAGKTTTISMLTGLLEPTSGQAEVFGIDIFDQMEEVRTMLGVCPQHDVLFEMLTPEDHLRIFAAFKGAESSAQLDQQVKEMLKDIDLYEQRNQISKTLSGGQKRKLSVAIALIGDSKVVMLDEPTSGMDTSARRRLWEMLKKNKNGRIVILTTHYMDEADILGDRIAIMAEGDVQCTGSSLFLKNRYGVGYNLTIAKVNRQPAPQVDKFIMDRIPSAKKMQEVSSEIAYQLPTESSSMFKAFFADFDANLTSLGIRSYGVGITTLEEVFLSIGHGEDAEMAREERRKREEEQELAEQEELKMKAGVQTIENSAQNTIAQVQDEIEEFNLADNGQPNFFDQLYQLTRKKILMQLRDQKTLFIDEIFPIILIVAGLALATVTIFQPGPDRTLSPSQLYPDLPNVFYYNENAGEQSTIDGPAVKDFLDQCIVTNDPNLFSTGASTSIDTSAVNITQQSVQFDNFVFSQVQDSGQASMGQFYLQNLQNDQDNGFAAIAYLNATSQDVLGSYASLVHEGFLKKWCDLTGSCSSNLKLTFVEHPFPLTRQFQAVASSAAGTTSAILMAIAWLMLSDSLIQNVIRERYRNIKHQIMISGSGLVAYWMSHYIADMLFQGIPALFGIAGVYAFDIDVPQVWVLFLLHIMAAPVFLYFLSFLFEKEESGSLVVKMVFFVVGIVAPIAISILQIFDNTVDIANALRWVFYPFPIFALVFGYISIANRKITGILQQLTDPKPFDIQIAGPAVYFLIGTTIFYWILIVCFEKKVFDFIFCQKGQSASDVRATFMGNQRDEDVEEEAERVAQSEPQQLPVRMANVSKTYGSVKAVKNASFGLEYGECFALLGISGAGKTTCFKCMTGEVYPTAGDLTICGYDVTTSAGFEQARKQIGYCPQFDAIFEGLTVLEHLEIYSALKGIPKSLRSRMIEKSIREMDLSDYRDIRANNLSGGNKRKLSVALAMLGNPPLVFLDEPSTGVDPQAKRFMWNIVSKISTLRKKSAVIITTHSMEEAEALCTKMGIMVGGEFKCFGSSQHIKDKFGTGYEIEVKVRTLTEPEVKQASIELDRFTPLNMNNIKTYLQGKGEEANQILKEFEDDGIYGDMWESSQEKPIDPAEFIQWYFTEVEGNKTLNQLQGYFKQFEVLEHYGNSWKLKVSRDNYSIGYLFGLMEDIQAQSNVSEYSVAQTTLEQIFNNFALAAEREGGKSRKRSTRRGTMSMKESRVSTK